MMSGLKQPSSDNLDLHLNQMKLSVKLSPD